MLVVKRTTPSSASSTELTSHAGVRGDPAEAGRGDEEKVHDDGRGAEGCGGERGHDDPEVEDYDGVEEDRGGGAVGYAGAITISGEDDGGGGVVANKEEARSPVPGEEEEDPRKRLGVVVHGDDGEEAKTVLAAAVGVFRVVILGVRDTWRYVCCPEVVCLKRRNLL
ncbi:hypothetical protein PI125_g8467 [Phytophthora idaei]|nr:hypothetical protein PI125_g8467 [Phytophthora idaei]